MSRSLSEARVATESQTIAAPGPLALDAKRIVTEVFPDVSERTWRRWAAAGRTPRGCKCGGRVLYRMDHLKKWAEWGFPLRAEFERRLRQEGA